MATVKVNITGDASSLKQATGQANTALGGLSRAGGGLKDTMVQAGVAIAGVTAVLATGRKAYEQTVGAVMNYNKAILDASRATRMGVEDMSRFVQVGDDMGVSMDSITRALQMATKNGFAPSISAIADLADRTNAMQSPTEKAAALSKMFGRNWAELNPILELGGARIRELAAAQQDGLVATEKEIAATEKLRLELDAMDDNFTAVKNKIGMAVVPALNEFYDASQRVGSTNPFAVWGQWIADGPTRALNGLAASAAEGVMEVGFLENAIHGLPRQTDLQITTYHTDVYGSARGGTLGSELAAQYASNPSAMSAQDAATARTYARLKEGTLSTSRVGGQAIGGVSTPGYHMFGEEGPELGYTDARGTTHILRAGVTRALSKGIDPSAHAIDEGGGRGVSMWKPKALIAGLAAATTVGSTGAGTPFAHSAAAQGTSTPTQQTQATAAQAVAEAAAAAIPQAVAQGTRTQTEAAQRIASDNAKANAANARTLAQIRDILLMQGGAKDIGREVGKANQLLDSRF